jgi:hypothetical protein
MTGTVIIKSDRVTFASLTADPASVTSGDHWFRSDLQRLKIAIDTVVANAKTMPVVPIASGDISDGAITSAKIASGAIASGHIASGAIASGHIASGQIATAHIVDSAITSAKVASGAIATTHIIDSAITSAKIASGAIASAHIGSGVISSGHIASGAIASAHIASGAIASGHIGSGQIGTAHLADSAVTTAKTNFANQLLLTTSTVSFAQVNVGDLVFKYGWRITESKNSLTILYNSKPLLTITKRGKLILPKRRKL